MSADHIVGKAVLFGDLSLLDEPEEFPGVVVSCSREVLRDVKRLPMQEEVALVPVSELAELKAERDTNARLKDENVLYARFLNESGFTEFRLIERAQELEWELNYAALCVAENETLREALRAQGKEAQVSLVNRVREAEESARALRRSYAEKIGENAALRSEIERWRTATAKLRDGADESARVATEQLARAEAELARVVKERDEALCRVERLGLENGKASAEIAELQAELDSSCNAEELLDWLEASPPDRLAGVRRLLFLRRETARESIDAAMKGGANG